MPQISEFAEKVSRWILGTVYKGLYGSVEKSMQGLFDSLDHEIVSATQLISAGPKQWNGSAFNLVQAVAENVCIPIAAAFITVIFCWELIHLVQESNNMNAVKPEKIFLVLLKFGLCLMVCAYSFKIVMGFCDVGIWSAQRMRSGNNISFASVSNSMTLADLGLEPDPDVYTDLIQLLGQLLELVGYQIMLVLAKFGDWICGVVVYVRVMIWFVEFLIYASAAPIPYSTWVNKEWSQVGMNYTRKMLALSFDGFFILLLFAIYGGVLGGLRLGDFKESLVMILGCGFGLAVMMFKAGNISASIFNAH